MTVRLLAHWLSFGPLLVLATFPAAALLNLEGETLRLLLLVITSYSIHYTKLYDVLSNGLVIFIEPR